MLNELFRKVPYLVDPNTGVELFESIDIRIYLDKVCDRKYK